MNEGKKPRSSRSKLNLKSQVFNLSCAKTYLGRLADKAMKGEPVYFIRGQQRFLLRCDSEMEQILTRPPGFFANCYTASEIENENGLSKASVIQVPKDLE